MTINFESIKFGVSRAWSLASMFGAGYTATLFENTMAGSGVGSLIALTATFSGSNRIAHSAKAGVLAAFICSAGSEYCSSLDGTGRECFEAPKMKHRVFATL